MGSDSLSQRLETPGEAGATVSKSSAEPLALDTSGTWTPDILRNPLITQQLEADVRQSWALESGLLSPEPGTYQAREKSERVN